MSTRPKHVPQPRRGALEDGLRVFLSYGSQDVELVERLLEGMAVLRRERLVEIWNNKEISPGGVRDDEIDYHLRNADLVLLGVSPAFLASDYCYDIEMTRALDQHRAGTSRVVPILLRPCEWDHTPLANLTVLPDSGVPVCQWNDPDEAWHCVVRKIRDITTQLRACNERATSKIRVTCTSSGMLTQYVFAHHAYLGRSRDAEFALRLAPREVGGLHLRFGYDRDTETFIVTDLRSKNGTTIDGISLREQRLPRAPFTLGVGRHLRFDAHIVSAPPALVLVTCGQSSERSCHVFVPTSRVALDAGQPGLSGCVDGPGHELCVGQDAVEIRRSGSRASEDLLHRIPFHTTSTWLNATWSVESI